MSYFCADIDAIDKWLSTAKPNSRFNYFSGYTITGSLISKAIGSKLYKLSTKGEIYLVLKRSADNRLIFDFFAIKASRPPVPSLVPYSDSKIAEKQKRNSWRTGNYVKHTIGAI